MGHQNRKREINEEKQKTPNLFFKNSITCFSNTQHSLSITMESTPRRSRKSRKDEIVPSSQTQSLAASLITFIFVVYGCGFFSTVLSLPPLNPREALSFTKNLMNLSVEKNNLKEVFKQRGIGLNIAKEGIVRDIKDFSQVPTSTWPVSVMKEKENWPEISHPADEDIKIEVPSFWSLPVHNNTLMPRSLAMSIGTCAKADPKTGSFQIGDKCPMDERTIFVAIASYRDWQCRHTIESIFNRAKYPHRIRVGVVDQILDGDDICNEPIEPCEDKPDQALCKYIGQVDNFVMDAPLSVGPVFARHIGHRLYRGEYYAMQSDAHVTFTQGKFSSDSKMKTINNEQKKSNLF